jgi:hypothetical protein
VSVCSAKPNIPILFTGELPLQSNEPMLFPSLLLMMMMMMMKMIKLQS